MNLKTRRLLRRFTSRMRYRRASTIAKPFINPVRFARNQLRKGLMKLGAVSISRVDTVHCRQFHVLDGEWVSEEIAGYGVYEPDLTETFIRVIEPGSLLIDVGMHLGYYSTLFAELTGPTGKVIAFEPTPSTRTFAENNVGRYPQISVRPEALWSKESIIDFNDYGIQWMAFNSAKGAKVELKDQLLRTFKVNCVTLDDYTGSLGQRVSLIKIDAESAELEILKGARNFLQRDMPLISMEVGDQEGQETSSKALEFAQSLGYKVWEVTEAGLKEHRAQKSYKYGNMILAEQSWKPDWQ